MTTIAFDGRWLAADGQETFNHEPIRLDRQKLAVRPGSVYGYSGVGCGLDAVIDWHASGADPKEAPKFEDNDWSMIAIDRHPVTAKLRLRYYTMKVPYPSEYHAPFALGSGADYATGAMDHGASAIEAVQIAIKRNVHTGGEIQSVEVEAALKFALPVAAE